MEGGKKKKKKKGERQCFHSTSVRLSASSKAARDLKKKVTLRKGISKNGNATEIHVESSQSAHRQGGFSTTVGSCAEWSRIVFIYPTLGKSET